MRFTVRTRIALDLFAAVALSMVIVVIGTLFIGRQVLWENAQIQTDRLASTLAAQIAAQRVPGQLLSSAGNRARLGVLLAPAVFEGNEVELSVRDRFGQEVWRLQGSLGPRPIVIKKPVPGGGMLKVRLSTNLTNLTLDKLTRTLLLLSLGNVVLVTLLAWWLLNRSVAAPVGRLINAVEQLQSEADEFPTLPGMGTELVALQTAIERMRFRMELARGELERRHIELQQAHDDLLTAQKVAERAEHLAGVGRLAAGIAHEVGNPLAALVGFVQLLSSERIPESKKQEVHERLERELNRIGEIIGRLLAYARPAREAMGPVDVAESVRSAAELVRADRVYRTVDLELALDDKTGPVTAEPNALRQVLVNLLLNAAEAMESMERGRVRVTIRPERRHLLLIVEDSGPGIPSEIRSEIFEPFFTTREVGKGTGLGLSVCHGLVRGWGGDIRVDGSELGGARFEVELRYNTEAREAS
ncbi:MAG: hypothetical protein CMH55_04820 [Myxococcales bacterium]|nr:hypothetical protein [Myxococcales bacterium]